MYSWHMEACNWCTYYTPGNHLNTNCQFDKTDNFLPILCKYYMIDGTIYKHHGQGLAHRHLCCLMDNYYHRHGLTG